MKRIFILLFVASSYVSLAQCNASNKPEPPVITFENYGSPVISICNVDVYEVVATSSTLGATIDWTQGSSLTGQPNGSTIPGIVSGPSQTYRAKAILNGCESNEATATVTIRESAIVTLWSDVFINGLCESDDVSNNPVF